MAVNLKRISEGSETRISRRSLLAWATGAGLVGSGLLSALSNFVFIKPRVAYGQPQRFSIGKPDDYPPGTRIALEQRRICVVRDGGRLAAMSTTCTHLGCIVGHRRHRFRLPLPRFPVRPGRQVTGGPAPARPALVQGHAWPPTARSKWTRTLRSHLGAT